MGNNFSVILLFLMLPEYAKYGILLLLNIQRIF